MQGDSSASSQIAGSRDTRGASDRGSVTPSGAPLDPVVGGSLEDALCANFMVHPASQVGKCHLTVPYSCTRGMYLRSCA